MKIPSRAWSLRQRRPRAPPTRTRCARCPSLIITRKVSLTFYFYTNSVILAFNSHYIVFIWNLILFDFFLFLFKFKTELSL